MSDRSVLLKEIGTVACLTIDRSAGGNILTGAVLDELSELLAALAERPEPPLALILTAAGDEVFLVGADPAEVVAYDTAAALKVSRRGQALADQIAAMPMPVLAAVNGLAIGGGVEMLLACDLAIASASAKFIQIETALGLVPGFGGIYRLPRRLGVSRANLMTFTAAPVSAETALARGLVVEVVPPDRLQSRAWELARQIAGNDGPALRLAKSLLGAGWDGSIQALDAEAEGFAACAGTASLKARVGAVIEERARARSSGE